jgi:hypothetical protein
VNNDGYDDVLVGAHQGDMGIKNNNGAAYLVLGSSSGISDMSLSSADAKLTGETSDDYAGYSISTAGDVNNDGYDDVLVATPYESTGGSRAGAAYLVLGSSSGISDMSLSSADAKLTGETSDDYAGSSVSAAGDVNNDGYADVLVGAHREDTGGTNAGAAYLVLGSSSGISDMSLSSAYAKLTGEGTNDAAGISVSAGGDVNNDGYADVLVGARHASAGGISPGGVYLVLGSSTGFSDMSLSSADAKLIGETSGDYAGSSVSTAGDVNNDGYSDVLVGAYGEDTEGTNTGAAYLIFGWAL